MTAKGPLFHPNLLLVLAVAGLTLPHLACKGTQGRLKEGWTKTDRETMQQAERQRLVAG